MGAIFNLKRMPRKCGECYFLDDKIQDYCHARKGYIIAPMRRSNRMPLCLLESEGEYMTQNHLSIKKYIEKRR